MDELREHLDELPKDQPIVAYCRVGLRGYLAARILKQNGFDVKNLSGGYNTYHSVFGKDRIILPQGSTKTQGSEGENDRRSAPIPPRFAMNANAGKKVDVELDACGMQCPGPIVRVNNEINSMQEG